MRRPWAIVALPLLLLNIGPAFAEPYLAVAKGLQCSSCHSNPAGGGKRNVYGNVFSQSELPVRRIGSDDDDYWTGEISRWLSIGGDLRADYTYVDTPNVESSSEFGIRARLYLEAHLIPGRLSVYVDQQVAPSASINREAYVRLNSANGKYFMFAGQFYLPYGLRIQDDTAFVRLATGINFTNPDRGILVGYESANWTTIASLTNGSGGGQEVDSGKQFSVVSSFVRARWRVGVSANINDADAGDREMFGLFAAVKTGPVVWLAEVDRITDDLSPDVSLDALAGLVEANWMFRQGHNLKLSYDVLDPNDSVNGDRQVRYSLLWEYSPMQFLQARFGLRSYDGVPAVDVQNRDTLFAELHGYF